MWERGTRAGGIRGVGALGVDRDEGDDRAAAASGAVGRSRGRRCGRSQRGRSGESREWWFGRSQGQRSGGSQKERFGRHQPGGGGGFAVQKAVVGLVDVLCSRAAAAEGPWGTFAEDCGKAVAW